MKTVKMAFLLLVCFLLPVYGSAQKKVLYFEAGRQVSEKEFIEKGGTGKEVLLVDGIKVSEIELKEGQKHGKAIALYPNGQKESEGKYWQGKKKGRWLKWDQGGSLLFEESWNEDCLRRIKDLVHFSEKTFLYYPGGQKKYERGFKGDKRHGKWIKWDVNGNKRYEREYQEGMKHGKWTTWDAQGNISGEEIWDMGEIIKKMK